MKHFRNRSKSVASLCCILCSNVQYFHLRLYCLDTYSNHTGQALCTACPPGSVTDTRAMPGATACTACGPGKYFTAPSFACADCAAGRFSAVPAAPSAASCTNCSAGRHGAVAGAASASACVACAAGSHQPAPGLALCRACPAGRYTDKPGSSADECPTCPAGKYQLRPQSSYCEAKVPCAPGRYDTSASTAATASGGNDVSPARCKPCAVDHFGIGAEHECKSCPVGKFQRDAGRFYCDDAKRDTLLRLVSASGSGSGSGSGEQQLEEWACPSSGRLRCEGGGSRSYAGGVWHDPRVVYPDDAQIFTCVTDGCPDEGAAVMACKAGYRNDSALCAVCDEGYFLQLRKCRECREPQWPTLGTIAAVIVVAAAAAAWFYAKYGSYLSPTLLTHFKIMVASVTILSTMDTQFGVKWPPAFLHVLSVLSSLTFDPTAICSGLCLFKVSFYDDLVFSTAGLAAAVVMIGAAAFARPGSRRACLKVGVYLLLFAYPLVSVKIVSVFGCHAVWRWPDGMQSYLRADYQLR